MRHGESLQRVLEHIDAHLGNALTAEYLAAMAGFSTYHFCRVFQWNVGYPVMEYEYVRNRRLSFAAAQLSADRRILDIALDYGFETHSGFSKAFRRRFGCTPERYRLHAHCFPPLPPSLAKMERYSIGGIVMEPKLVTLPAIPLAGYLLKTTTSGGENSKAIPAFWAAYMQDGRMTKLHGEAFVKKHDEYGACFSMNPDTGELDYVIGIAVDKDAQTPAAYHRCEIPPATYAVFSTPPSEQSNFTASIQGVWQYIYNDWFPNCSYEFAPNCVDFELYHADLINECTMVCDIYIPIVKK